MDCFPASSPLIDRLYENGVNTDYKTVMEVTPTVTHPSAGYEKISDASRIEQPRRVPVLPGFLQLIAPRAAPVPSRIGTVSAASGCYPLQRQLDLFQVMLVMPRNLVEFGFQGANAGFAVHILEVSVGLVVQPRVVDHPRPDRVEDLPGELERHVRIVQGFRPCSLI